VNALPALTTITTAAVRRQFEPAESAASPGQEARPRTSSARLRLALAAALDRAARAVAPTGYRPAH
jgi:hypothetical protein